MFTEVPVVDFQRLAEAVRSIEERIPFNRLLGLELTSFSREGVEVRFRNRDDLVGNFTRGNLHGGAISAALDLAGGLAAFVGVVVEEGMESLEEAEARFERLGTIDLRVDYLRPALGEEFTAGAITLRVGRRVAVTRMELHNDRGDLVAAGSGTYMVA
ncbi:MAG: thioesterase family protein [Acidimicrobiia bacterium]